MQARIKAIRWEAEDILSFTLEPLGGGLMPAFEPGAHIDVQLARACRAATRWPMTRRSAGLTRSACIFADQPGGSRHIHERWRAGEIIEISRPRTISPWSRTPHTVLIAGGIGITRCCR
jgi:vanillate O-demethylase ferredoxin subunit